MGEVVEGPWTKKEQGEESKKYNWTINTNLEAIGETDEKFLEKLRENGWSDDEVQELWYGFHEALANAVGHGNLQIQKVKGDMRTTGELMEEELKKHPEKKDKKVEIMVEVNKNKVRVEITDEGNGFKTEEVPDPTTLNGQQEAKGRGLLFMKNFFDSIEYEKITNEKGEVVGHKVILAKEKKG